MLELREVYFTPNGNKVLDGVNLRVDAGEIFVIMGASGAGKSTILRLINGLIRPDGGEIFVAGILINELSEKELASIRKKVGMVFQSAALFDSLTVAENVGFAWRKDKLSQAEMTERINHTLAVVGMDNIGERMPADLSGGMKKRVGLARAIAMNPEALLYDEPTAGLDPMTSNTILKLIQDLNARLNVTSVVVTHDVPGAFAIADRVALLDKGKIAFIGTVDEMKESTDLVVQDFILGNTEQGAVVKTG